MIEKNWQMKEKRELFCKCVNCYIMKSGADKDPVIDTILPIAKKVVDKAFVNYPNEEEEKETQINFPQKNEKQ